MAAKSKEDISEYNKRYWREHKEEIKKKRGNTTEKTRAWREANRERWNAYMREYRRKKKEEREREEYLAPIKKLISDAFDKANKA